MDKPKATTRTFRLMPGERIADRIFPEAKRMEQNEQGLCVLPPFGCGQPLGPFRNEISRKEFRLSGRCQKCQDRFFGKD